MVTPRWRASVPAERGDRRNLRYRRHLAHPWLSATILFVVVFGCGPPLAWSIIDAGGIPSKSPDLYWAWHGSPAKGRSSAVAVVALVGLVIAGASLWEGILTRREREEVRLIDAARIAAGVPKLAHDATPPLEHRWFDLRRRRKQAVEQIPAPRSAPHQHPPSPKRAA
jgi:hypothetical protein